MGKDRTGPPLRRLVTTRPSEGMEFNLLMECQVSENKVPRLLTVKELSDATGLPQWRVYELIALDMAPPWMKIGKTFRFPEDGVVRWIRERTSKKESAA